MGIACYNDEVAIALMDACRILDRRIPEDVALVGVDAIPLSALVWPRLTTISIDLEVIFATLGAIVIDQIAGKSAEIPDLTENLHVIPGGTTR